MITYIVFEPRSSFSIPSFLAGVTEAILVLTLQGVKLKVSIQTLDLFFQVVPYYHTFHKSKLKLP